MNQETQTLLNEVDQKRGKSGGWPQEFTYDYKSETKQAFVEWSLNNKDKKTFRQFDSWGLAFLALLQENNCEVKIITYDMKFCSDEDTIHQCNFESLRRRISYLNVNNTSIDFTLKNNGKTIDLFDLDSLYNRSQNEIVRPDSEINDRAEEPISTWRLEKDFQAFLFGTNKKSDNNTSDKTSERLALLGDDFYNMNTQLKKWAPEFRWIQREFPTGVFTDQVAESCRLLPTEFVDIISLNKYGRLSIIELKANDTSLEVASQLLDYALFIRCYYWPRITAGNSFVNNNEVKEKDRFESYVVSNRYHQRFDRVFLDYISPKDVQLHKFQFSKLTLGFTQRINQK